MAVCFSLVDSGRIPRRKRFPRRVLRLEYLVDTGQSRELFRSTTVAHLQAVGDLGLGHEALLLPTICPVVVVIEVLDAATCLLQELPFDEICHHTALSCGVMPWLLQFSALAPPSSTYSCTTSSVSAQREKIALKCGSTGARAPETIEFEDGDPEKIAFEDDDPDDRIGGWSLSQEHNTSNRAFSRLTQLKSNSRVIKVIISSKVLFLECVCAPDCGYSNRWQPARVAAGLTDS